MTSSIFPVYRRSSKSTRMFVLMAAVLAILIVACSPDDQQATATPQPAVTQVPTATQAPDPTAVPATATDVPPTKAVPPTVTPVPPTATIAPTATVAPTATPVTIVELLLLATGEVNPNRFTTVAPGGADLYKRYFAAAPPEVPHTIADLAITIDVNQCADCHAIPDEGGVNGGNVATEIPLSHYTNPATGVVSETLDPRRYGCATCHVQQVTDPFPYPIR